MGAAFCRQLFMDEDGHWTYLADLEQRQSGILENALERMASDQIVLTPSIVVRREAYEKLGGFDRRLICAEDWGNVGAGLPPATRFGTRLSHSRSTGMHLHSNTGRHTRSGDDRLYAGLAVRIFQRVSAT